MRILLASSELHPYSKTGGLADMVGALGKNLALAGHRVGVVTPFYRSIRARHAPRPFDWEMALPMGPNWIQPRVHVLEPEPNLTVYFIEAPQYFDRDGIYGDATGGFWDNGERYIAFAKAVVHLARYLPWQPEAVHVHDWQTALVPLLIRAEVARGGWTAPPRTVLTIHNLAYQGVHPLETFGLTNLPPTPDFLDAAMFEGSLNLLKAGIQEANAITTVSPRYAREIMTPEYGERLDDILQQRRESLHGILNGVDYDEWRTTGNPYLPFPYDAEHLEGKARNKAALQKEMGLPEAPDVPLFGTVGRLADQKGIDISVAALEEMLAARLQFVVLGSGQKELQDAMVDLAARYPEKMACRVGFDVALSHRIEAGCDFFLMPSRFEPCGLNQMYSLRYGTIPIVRRTGGLENSVCDLRDDPELANGIKFDGYSGRALGKAMQKALALYASAEWLSFFRRNAMAADFSWDRTRKAYEALYRGEVPENLAAPELALVDPTG